MVVWRKPGGVALVGVAVVTACALSEKYTRVLQGSVSDDAVTSMQYAKNLVLGHGLVFNVGERVDGYTNFLWVLFMAPLFLFSRLAGVDLVGTVVQVSIGLEALVFTLLFVVGASLWRARLGLYVALFLCVIDNSFLAWADLGLEVHFLAFWLLCALALWRSRLSRRSLFTGLALSAAMLTRPDAALFGASVIGSELVEAGLAYARGARREARGLAHGAGKMAVAWLVPYAFYFVWHYWYYGEPLPNTYYTKLGGPIDAWSRGFEYLTSFLDVRGWVPALGVFALFGARDKTIRAVFAYLAVHTLYVVYAGGDFMPGHRFFMPQLPLYYLLVGASLELSRRALERPRLRAWLEPRGVSPAFVTGFALASSIALLGFLADREQRLGPLEALRASWGVDHERQRRFMTWLSEHKPEGATFATGLIGHVGFFGDIYVIDTCGIIDRATAHKNVRHFGQGLPGHEKQASPEAVLARKPTYVGIYVLPGDLWRRGYYLDIDVPPRTVEGVWVRDELPVRGHFLESTRIDFDQGSPLGWTANGTAFETWPTRDHHPGQGEIAGAEGAFVNSYHPKLGTQATGVLRSAPFKLEGDLLVFRMAGGEDEERLRASLLIDGQPVFSATAHDNGTMGRRAWKIAPYRGKNAVFELVDAATESWGYVAVDEIVQWVGPPDFAPIAQRL